MNAPSSDYRAVLDFWFRETAPQQWFARSDAFDGIIRQRFFAVWQRAAQGELADWRGNMQGSSRRSDTCIRPTAFGPYTLFAYYASSLRIMARAYK